MSAARRIFAKAARLIAALLIEAWLIRSRLVQSGLIGSARLLAVLAKVGPSVLKLGLIVSLIELRSGIAACV